MNTSDILSFEKLLDGSNFERNSIKIRHCGACIHDPQQLTFNCIFFPFLVYLVGKQEEVTEMI